VAKSNGFWLAVALAALIPGGLLSWWIVTPSLGVKCQLQIDRWCEQLAAHAAKQDGVFPAEQSGCISALGLTPETFRDPWGRVYQYERVSAKGPFRLWSTGADGRDDRGGGDDIASWTR
jgi:hypothetical protein